MAILVCGGAGYIGSHCVRELQRAKYECIIYDNFSEGHKNSIRDCKIVEGDLRDREKLRTIFQGNHIEGVIHFASYALVGISMKRPLEYYNNNVYATMCLLEEMKHAGIKYIVFSSTCATYGEPVYIPIDEKMAANPCNPYGQTKKDIEAMLKWCDYAYDIKSVCLRYFNAAGAFLDGSIGEDHRLETHIIPIIFQNILNKRDSIQIYGNDYPTEDGSCIRDYIHVLDLADAHIKALQYLFNGKQSEIFNLGTGIGTSVFQMIQMVQRVTEKKVRYTIAPRRLGDPAQLVASAKKAEKVLGWIPHYSDNETIIKSAWEWHRTHPDGYCDG